MKFKLKPEFQHVFEGFQWFKNGDHPEDNVFRPFEDTGKTPTEPREGKVVRYYRYPGVPGDSVCRDCSRTMRDHGWLDNYLNNFQGQIICPGSWIFFGEKTEPHYEAFNSDAVE